ncbi:MAG: fibrobacter succinogenes major paralogous domain-containing protein, partial [Bacteroidales bacterium]
YILWTILFRILQEIVPIVFNPGIIYNSVTDIEGNTYKTVQIGTQTWMAENLLVTKYNDGTDISYCPSSDWSTISSGAYCEYRDVSGNTYIATYGRLYNYYAVTGSHNVCPAGWHVPLGLDLEQLITFLGGFDVAGDKMRETGITHWADYSNQNDATNDSGFTGLPGGMRDPGGSFLNLGHVGLGYWWFVFDPGNLGIANGFSLSPFNNSVTIEPSGNNTQKFGLSVRCVKDN